MRFTIDNSFPMTQRTSFFPAVIAVVLFAIFSVISSGCGNSGSTDNTTTGGGSNYGGNYFPKVGTTYTYQGYQTDSMGMKVPGSDTAWTATVISDNANFMGKSKVFQVDDNGTKNYYTYEDNGDVDLYLDQSSLGLFSFFIGNYLNQWFTFPTASHIKGLIVFDSTISLPGFGDIEIIGRIDYLGEEELVVGIERHIATKCALKVSSLLFKYEQTFRFVPEIGYFAKMTTSTSLLSLPGLGGGFTSGSDQTLIAYSLK